MVLEIYDWEWIPLESGDYREESMERKKGGMVL